MRSASSNSAGGGTGRARLRGGWRLLPAARRRLGPRLGRLRTFVFVGRSGRPSVSSSSSSRGGAAAWSAPRPAPGRPEGPRHGLRARGSAGRGRCVRRAGAVRDDRLRARRRGQLRSHARRRQGGHVAGRPGLGHRRDAAQRAHRQHGRGGGGAGAVGRAGTPDDRVDRRQRHCCRQLVVHPPELVGHAHERVGHRYSPSSRCASLAPAQHTAGSSSARPSTTTCRAAPSRDSTISDRDLLDGGDLLHGDACHVVEHHRAALGGVQPARAPGAARACADRRRRRRADARPMPIAPSTRRQLRIVDRTATLRTHAAGSG